MQNIGSTRALEVNSAQLSRHLPAVLCTSCGVPIRYSDDVPAGNAHGEHYHPCSNEHGFLKSYEVVRDVAVLLNKGIGPGRLTIVRAEGECAKENHELGNRHDRRMCLWLCTICVLRRTCSDVQLLLPLLPALERHWARAHSRRAKKMV